MRLTLKQLAVFEAVARTGSVSRAAAEVHLSQSATSASLKELEAQLGIALFDRRGKRLTVNARGKALHARAHGVLQGVHDMEAMAKETLLGGLLRIGATGTIASYVLPGLCGRFLDAHPEARIEVVVGSATEIMNAVERMALDIGFIEAPSNRAALDSEPWIKDDLVFFVGPHHPLAERPRVPPDAMKKYPWYLHPVHWDPRTHVLTALLEHINSVNIVFTSAENEAIKRAVASSLGIGCLSRLALENELKNLTLREISVRGIRLSRISSVITRKGAFRSELLEQFVAHARSRPGSGRKRSAPGRPRG